MMRMTAEATLPPSDAVVVRHGQKCSRHIQFPAAALGIIRRQNIWRLQKGSRGGSSALGG